MYERQKLLYSVYKDGVHHHDSEMFLSYVSNSSSGSNVVGASRRFYRALTDDREIERGMTVQRGTDKWYVNSVNGSGRDVIVELWEIL